MLGGWVGRLRVGCRWGAQTNVGTNRVLKSVPREVKPPRAHTQAGVAVGGWGGLVNSWAGRRRPKRRHQFVPLRKGLRGRRRSPHDKSWMLLRGARRQAQGSRPARAHMRHGTVR